MSTSNPIISNPASFHAEAKYQRICAVCEKAGPFHAHHVYPKQRLRQMGRPQHDTRCALRLCVPCHMNFEHAGPGKVQVLVRHLVQPNICYLFELLGDATEDFLAREYAYAGGDMRVQLHTYHACLHCGDQ